MTNIFIQGGLMFMATLTLILAAIITLAIMSAVSVSRGQETNTNYMKYVKNLGLFGLVAGVFFHLSGLYQAFGVIQEIGNVSPSVIMGGLKVAMIPALYGAIIFLISYLLWFGLGVLRSKSMKA